MRFKTERSFGPNAQPPVGMLLEFLFYMYSSTAVYVHLAVFIGAPREPDLNSIPKWFGTSMARSLWIQRTIALYMT